MAVQIIKAEFHEGNEKLGALKLFYLRKWEGKKAIIVGIGTRVSWKKAFP